ncbi:MAG: RNA-directed DNA polymerase [Nitrospira sp.]|nr:RNA-directed DNA polymerase [Nitrospira sp.]
MLRLSDSQLDAAFSAIQHHGYGSFFPLPPEFPLIDKAWVDIRAYLSQIDLDTYLCHDALKTFVPKSRLNVRFVSFLHPFDLILYTALVMILRDHIAASRLPIKSHKVFSFRSEKASGDMLYTSKPGYREFRDRQRRKIQVASIKFVGVADIADFYPRIYQHRLKNALEAATSNSQRDVIRVLEKLLLRFSGGPSYGIPVGPAASRLLGEAVLIDVDSALRAAGVDFLRFVDDFVIFGSKYEMVESALHFLGETLFVQHGLTLQTAKTHIFTDDDFKTSHLLEHSEKETTRRRLIEIMMGDDYEERSYDELEEEERAEVDALNLAEMLEDALSPDQVIDYSEVNFILGRLSALKRPDLIPIVLKNIKRLYPVAHSVAVFFQGFDALPSRDRKRIAKALIDPLVANRKPKPPVYYAIWILHLFSQNIAWNHADDLLNIFREHPSQIVKRYAALALSSSGSRAHALVLKEHLSSAPSLVRTAILLGTKKLGEDERGHWLRAVGLTDPLEKLVAHGRL